jgi:hypothetical protein
MKAPTTQRRKQLPPDLRQRHSRIPFQKELKKISDAFFQLASEIDPGTQAIGNTAAIERDDPLTKRRLKIVNTRENRYGAAIFCGVGFVLYWAYVSFILLNMNYTYDFTQMRLSNSPDPFNTSRYTYPWAMSYMLFFNILGPVTLMAAVAEIQYKSRLRVHWVINVLLSLANIVGFFSFLGIWIGYCNTGYSFGSSCDSPQNCCVNYGSSLGITWCPVTAGCTPAVTSSQLSRWDPFFLSFLWALFFGIYGFFAFAVNRSLRKLKNPRFIQKQDRGEVNGVDE